jgi:hypothetical protein
MNQEKTKTLLDIRDFVDVLSDYSSVIGCW